MIDMSLPDESPATPHLSAQLDHQLVLKHEDEKHGEHSDQDAIDYPGGLKLILITVALCLSVFLVALDNTIIATAIPKITDQFQSLDDVGWYGSAYLLTTAAVQLLFGRLYTVLSIKWVYIAAISLFEIGSVVCGAAPTSSALIIGRAIAGLGSAGIASGASIIVAHTVPLEKRPNYIGLIGGMYGISSVAGPLVGGVFTDKVSWRWCFYINLPIGAVTLLVIMVFFESPASRKPGSIGWAARINQFDPFGTVTFVVAIVCVLLALQWGGTKYPWSDGRIVSLFILCGVLISIFTAIQIRMQEQATLPPRILKQRSIMSASWFAFCSGSSFFILAFFVPIWFQAVKGVSAIQSGINSIPMVLSLVISSIIAGGLTTYIGVYAPFMILASFLMSAGAGVISTFTSSTGHAHWIGFQVIYGLGVGFGMQQPILASQTVLSLEDIPVGTSLVMLMESLGGAIFVSVGQNIFSNQLISGLTSRVPGVDPASVLNAGATSLRNSVDAQYLPSVLSVYNQALVSAFYVSIAMAGLSLVGALAIEWESVKKDAAEKTMG
ncbi:major facilitator superfamily domain-containing protein [Mycena crocata]|nr:major facilitator superfamily domain-containing protein [Mycena crocata]